MPGFLATTKSWGPKHLSLPRVFRPKAQAAVRVMINLGNRCAVLLCALSFVGCDNREKLIVKSDYEGQSLPDVISSSGSGQPTLSTELDTNRLPTIVDATPSFATPSSPLGGAPSLGLNSENPSWLDSAGRSAGLLPRDGDIRFAELTAEEQKKTSTFERELRAGIEALNTEKTSAAIEHFEAAEKADPRDFRPFFYESLVRVHQNSIPQAAAALDIAIQLAPQQVELYLHRGNLRLREGQHSLAVDDFTRVLAVHPTHLPALINRAGANWQLRRPKDVVADTTEVIKLRSGIPDAHLLRALGYLVQGETVLARRDFDAAVAAGLPKKAAEDWAPVFRGRS